MSFATAVIPIAHGWVLAMDGADAKRWNPETIMPTVMSAVSHADTFVIPIDKPTMSDDLIVNVGPIPCVVVLTRYPPNPMGMRGTVWIGTTQEAGEFREKMGRQGLDRFKARAGNPDAN